LVHIQTAQGDTLTSGLSSFLNSLMLILKGLTLVLALFIFAVLAFAAFGFSAFSPTYSVSGGAFLVGVGPGSKSDWLGLLVFGRVAMAHIAKIPGLVH
jgi:hypothetical protein